MLRVAGRGRCNRRERQPRHHHQAAVHDVDVGADPRARRGHLARLAHACLDAGRAAGVVGKEEQASCTRERQVGNR